VGRLAANLDSERLKEWAGQRKAPIVIYENARPRSGWAEILRLAERLAASPSLLPPDPADRALVFGLAREVCGEAGSAGRVGCSWCTLVFATRRQISGQEIRLQPRGRRCRRPASRAPAMLVARLKAQRHADCRYYVGNSLTAADVCSAHSWRCQPRAAPAMQNGRQHARQHLAREPRTLTLHWAAQGLALAWQAAIPPPINRAGARAVRSVLTLKRDDHFCRFWFVWQQTSPLRIAPAGEIYHCARPGLLVLLYDIQSVAIEEERVIAKQFVQFRDQRMVVRDHLGLELRQSLFDLLGIQFHDAFHSLACRAPHLLNGSPPQACRRVR
jgi:glutathione S-transferase